MSGRRGKDGFRESATFRLERAAAATLSNGSAAGTFAAAGLREDTLRGGCDGGVLPPFLPRGSWPTSESGAAATGTDGEETGHFALAACSLCTIDLIREYFSLRASCLTL